MSSLYEELMNTIGEWNIPMEGGLSRTTPLISSGRLDSLALFRLMVWIEQKIGRPVDATAIDIATEWDTVDCVVAFIERETGT